MFGLWLKRISSAAYANGAVYLLQLLKAGNPRRALREYLGSLRRDEKRLLAPVDRREVSVGGNAVLQEEVRGRSYENDEPYYRKLQYFTTKRYLCIVSATTRDGATAEVNEFFSSLKFGRGAADTGAADGPPQTGRKPDGAAALKGDVYEAKDVTRRAVLVWQPPLDYQLMSAATEIDRNRFEMRVQATLAANGEVTDVKVLGPSSHGVVAIATEMTRHAKFIPAELNGRPVAQRHTFKYTLWTSG